uniref:Zygote arrest protein 1-like n=1 Tax=Phallusia mammillata TaxID=59560 RepID=A0A6F9DXT2_9ASCI|nr:zygote arrest protein 1-like [Phallusia mammillata]
MSIKAAFRLSTHEKPLKADFAGAAIRKHEVSNEERNENNQPSPGRSPTLIWQNLTPELRVEALRRAHLVQLLKQVNPDLQLCRKSTSEAAVQVKSTSEKGIQVPDIRFEFAAARKPKPRVSQPRPEINASVRSGLLGPGVRIQPKTKYNATKSNSNSIYCGVRQPPPFPGGQFFQQRQPWINPSPRSFLRADAPPHIPRNTTIRRPLSAQVENQKRNQVQSNDSTNEKRNDEGRGNSSPAENPSDPGGGKDEQKENTSKMSKSGATSSGDDDSVVVVLDEPKRERDLERKYGQFFCRRCLRGWSSRNLWCVRATCKVYIKQTCNTCNKVVRPYLVCNLPSNTPLYRDKAGPRPTCVNA